MNELGSNQSVLSEQFSSILYDKYKNKDDNTIMNIVIDGIERQVQFANIEGISQTDNYLHIAFKQNTPIIKLGYSCSPNGIGQKIQLHTANNPDAVWETFEIGKTGMFEFQVEDITVLDEEIGLVKKDAIIKIYGIKVPIYCDTEKQIKIDYVIDYSYIE